VITLANIFGKCCGNKTLQVEGMAHKFNE